MKGIIMINIENVLVSLVCYGCFIVMFVCLIIDRIQKVKKHRKRFGRSYTMDKGQILRDKLLEYTLKYLELGGNTYEKREAHTNMMEARKSLELLNKQHDISNKLFIKGDHNYKYYGDIPLVIEVSDAKNGVSVKQLGKGSVTIITPYS